MSDVTGLPDPAVLVERAIKQSNGTEDLPAWLRHEAQIRVDAAQKILNDFWDIDDLTYAAYSFEVAAAFLRRSMTV